MERLRNAPGIVNAASRGEVVRIDVIDELAELRDHLIGISGRLVIFNDARFRQDGHILTCAPTGAGKGIGAVIPNLLAYPGSAFVLVDPSASPAKPPTR